MNHLDNGERSIHEGHATDQDQSHEDEDVLGNVVNEFRSICSHADNHVCRNASLRVLSDSSHSVASVLEIQMHGSSNTESHSICL